MFLSLSFAVLLASIPPEADRIVASFVDGLQRRDRIAIRGRRPLRHSLGTSYDRLTLHENIHIDSWRIVSAEPADEGGVFLNVELDGTADTTNTGQHVPWPRWWSIHILPVEGVWMIDTATMRERRLAERHWKGGADELRRVVAEYPDLALHWFAYFVADHTLNSATKEQSEANYQWMLQEGTTRGDPWLQSFARQMLAEHATKFKNDPGEALELAERSLGYAEASGEAEVITGSYYEIGEAHSRAGRIEEAIKAYRRAASYYDRSFDPRAANESLQKASELELERNNLRAALADVELYRTMTARLSFPSDKIRTLSRLADIHERLGNADIARAHYEELLQIAVVQHHPEWQLRAAQKIAAQEKAMGNSVGARALLEDAREGLYRHVVLDPELIVMHATDLAALQREMRDLDGAESTIDRALAKIAAVGVQAKSMADLYVQRSRLRLAEGRLDDALADARLAREQTGSPHAGALAAEGLALRALGQNTEAEEVLRAAIDLVEIALSNIPSDAVGRGRILNAKLGTYRELLDLLAEQGCTREALSIAERMRARSLREMLQRGRVDVLAGLDAKKRDEERALEQRLADVNRRILAGGNTAELARMHEERDAARRALRSFRSELYAMVPAMERSHADADFLPPAVAPGELVLEYAVLDQETIVFALRGNAITMHRIVIPRDALERQVDQFVSAIEQRDLGYRTQAHALYDILLGPLAESLRGAASVRIVPDGPIWRLPFHALVDRRGSHLIERMPVAYSPSLAITRTATPHPGAQRTLLAFGDPAVRTETAAMTRSMYRDVELGRLPDAATEARAIARFYGDANVRTGADAREDAFKNDAPSYRVLHLAAHSIIDDRTPMFSSIVLASSGKDPVEDGLLDAREIAALDLHADVAVLSACATARGSVTAGEGVVGLSWAFLAAGVPTTVVSQWKVVSASTAELMIDFHRRMSDGQKTAEALRTAMLALRRNPRWRHPFYWAPFAAIENSGIPAKRQ